MEPEPVRQQLAWLDHPSPLVRWGGRAWLFVGLVLAAWALWHVTGIARLVLAPLVIALFPAGVLMPVVDRLQEHRWRRGAAAFVAAAAFLLLVLAVFALLGWQISRELSGLAEQMRGAYDNLRSSLGSPSWLPTEPKPASLLGGTGGGGGQGGTNGAAGTALVFGRSVMEVGAQFFLGIVALFFYLRDRTPIGNFLVGLFPPGVQHHAREIGRRSWRTVTEYIRGQTIVALVDGVLFAIGLLVLGVPLAWVLGAIVAIGAYVPVVGSIVAGAIGVGVALISGGLTTGLLALALIVGVQQLEGNVLAPYVLGHELDLHPLAVLVAVTLGAAVLGPFGALIGVPVAASLYQASGYIRDEVA